MQDTWELWKTLWRLEGEPQVEDGIFAAMGQLPKLMERQVDVAVRSMSPNKGQGINQSGFGLYGI